MSGNMILQEMQLIHRKTTPNNYSTFVSCDMCHHNAWFSYLYNGEILYRCQIHKIIDITKLKHKYGYGDTN